jgi:hypothetical protein
MNKSKIFFSSIYSILQITQGLLIHPYQTMQSLVKEKVFVWMTLLPTISLGLITVLWKVLLVPFIKIVFSCKSGFIACSYIGLTSNWLTIFHIYWQVILIYLLFRFERIFNEN